MHGSTKNINLEIQSTNRKKAGAGRHAAFPDVEKRLFEEFQELRGKGVKVKE